MVDEYYTYRICVLDRQLVRVTKSHSQNQLGEASGKFRSDRLTDDIKTQIEKIRNPSQGQHDTSLLGKALFDVLFDRELSQDFLDFYHQVVEQEKQLMRVELEINEEGFPEIAALPWEFMCVPKKYNAGNIWLATHPKLVFLRRRQQQTRGVKLIRLNQDEKLKIALVVSKPSDLGDVISYPVEKALSDLTNNLAEKIQLLPVVSPATPEKINDLLAQEPHIFHFIGHGRLQNHNNQEVGQIAFVQEYDSSADWRNADFFSGLFNRHRPRIVVLQACEGAKQSESEAFVSVASSLVNQNIPVVVAMQFEVSNPTATKFARKFYEQIAQGKPVDIAVQESRYALTLTAMEYKTRDFATPVIFMSVPDGYLFQEQEKTNPPIDKTDLAELNSINLVGSQRQQLCEALLDAFRNKKDLEIMLSFELDWQLNRIAGGENNEQIVFALIDYAESQGQLKELLEAAKRAIPGNPKLRKFYF